MWQNYIPHDSHRKTCGSTVCVCDHIHTQLNNNNNQHFHIGHSPTGMWFLLATFVVSSSRDINNCLLRC